MGARDFRWPPPPGGAPERFAPRSRAEPGRPLRPFTVPTELLGINGTTLECLTAGTGDPVTVFAHGFAGGIADTRPYGSAVTGTKVFFQFRGHGRSGAPARPWSYADFADDLRGVADRFGARRALGVSLGAAALTRLLTGTPDRFDRVVFVLPAVLDEPRSAHAADRARALLAAVNERDQATTTDLLAQDIPTSVRDSPAAWQYLRDRLDQLFRDGLAPALDDLLTQPAVADRTALAGVTARALVIGCVGDRTHPARVAEALAAALPDAELHIYPRPALLWSQRADLRQRVAGFLND
ncbi:alpha/beta hydrolase [Luedemannella helvata]|uniref:Serine aminopeptidase S33 domain-containing protein n=1 Tax=Luedemannella helvata TaxID=349315 RepID=A0ABN2L133_9ACTN